MEIILKPSHTEFNFVLTHINYATPCNAVWGYQGCGVGVGRNFKWSRSRKEF
jgi:hypothetical protein